MYYVYISRSSKSGRLYTGFTSNLRKRPIVHSSNMGGYTSGRGPYRLVYYEARNNIEDALARELYLKSGMGKRYIKNRIRRFLSLTG